MIVADRKAQFLDELDTRDLGGDLWCVISPLRFYSAKYHRTFKVPAGCNTDLASIPLWIQVIGALIALISPFRKHLFSKSGKYNRAAVLHDSGYSGTLTDHFGYALNVSKTVADNLFLEAMLADGVEHREAHGMYRAVSWFGNPERSRKKNGRNRHSTD